MRAFLFILGALVFAAFGIAMAYLTSGWIGYKVTLWGSAVFIFFGVIIGIKQSALEGIVVTGVYTGAGYLILRTIPELFPIFSGTLLGESLFSIVMGIRAEVEEAPWREVEQRALEEERARDEAARREQEAEWEETRRKEASLPIPSPKADIQECFKASQTYLDSVWSGLPPHLFEPNDQGYELINTWLQRQFIRIVEVPLGCRISHTYGEYDPEYNDDLPADGPEPKTPQTRPMEIWVNGDQIGRVFGNTFFISFPFTLLVQLHMLLTYQQPPICRGRHIGCPKIRKKIILFSY